MCNKTGILLCYGLVENEDNTSDVLTTTNDKDIDRGVQNMSCMNIEEKWKRIP